MDILGGGVSCMVQFHLFSYSFRQNNKFFPLLRSWCPPRLGNPGSSTGKGYGRAEARGVLKFELVQVVVMWGPPHMNGQTDTTENITFPQVRWR